MRFLFAIGILFVVPSGWTAAGPADELKALRARIEVLRKELIRAEGGHTEAADALKASEQAISDANRRLRELAASGLALDRRIAALKGRQEALQGDIARQQALAGQLIRHEYTAPRGGIVEWLGGADDPNALARNMVYLGYVARARAAVLQRLAEDRAALQQLVADTIQARRELAANEEARHEERRRLEVERAERREVLAKLSTELARQRNEMGALQRSETRLSRLVEELAKMLASRRPSPPSAYRAPDASTDGLPFQQLKGRLRLPVRGELSGRFGSPRADTGLSWRGLFIRAAAGQDVRAVAAGRVVFADWLRGFGNLLILDHGGGFMSLYGNNESLIRRLGDQVSGGDPIATVGASGGNPETGLYFELRHQGKPIDPDGWMILR